MRETPNDLLANESLKGSARRGLIAAFAGGFIQAIWALYVNFDYPRDIYVTASLTQGATSFMMSFLITIVMDQFLTLYSYFKDRYHQFILTLLSSMLVMVFVHFSFQTFVGTPRVWITISPALLIGTLYCFFYIGARLKVSKVSSERG
jgi:hypothetical protein